MPLMLPTTQDPVSEVLLGVRPVLFDFPRCDLCGIDVTVAEGRGFPPMLGQQLCVCLAMDTSAKQTGAADAISRPVWGERFNFPVGPRDALQVCTLFP